MSSVLFEAIAPALRQRAGREPAWLVALREQAVAILMSRGLPTARDEDWQFTPIGALSKQQFAPLKTSQPPPATAIAAQLVDGADQLVFVDGAFCSDLSRSGGSQSGVTIEPLSKAIVGDSEILKRSLGQAADLTRGFVALNTALAEDGAVITIESNVDLKRPIQLVFVSSGRAGLLTNTRNLLVLGKGARATVIETFVSLADGNQLDNLVTEALVGENAQLTHHKINNRCATYHLASLDIRQQRDSRIDSLSLTLGGKMVRNDINSQMAAEGGHCALNGLYVTSGDDFVDHHTAIDHAVANCTSSELYKGILGGRSRAVFNGKIFVRQDAQHTEALQSNRNLLLSSDATINTKPQLEIFADDVRCTHGATIGQLDEEQLFYLQARGIAADTARSMLTGAFVGEVLGHIKHDGLREKYTSLVEQHLRAV
ncbi:MAG: Fe-S cluster assembly protein SufD [Deltaproteobacteria bacterium]|nr:Fe-S cluster assembly protein SufD [Deltaproteobacteria bacterium]